MHTPLAARPAVRPSRPRAGSVAALLGAVLGALLAGGCVGGVKSGRRPAFEPPPEEPAGPVGQDPDVASANPPGSRDEPVVETPVILEDRYVGTINDRDLADLRRDWRLFLRKDRAWPEARDRWLARGGPFPYVIAENLLRYFLSASAYGDRRDLSWIAVSAKKIGEPSVGYFGSLLILDQRPLQQAVRLKGKDGTVKLVQTWINDDVTRQQLAMILAYVGEPAVATLSSDAYLRGSSSNARRYVMYALGRIGSDRAVDALAPMLGAGDWQDRATAAKSLGVALAAGRNERARAPLLRAANDPDAFVRKKVEEALAGRSKLDF